MFSKFTSVTIKKNNPVAVEAIKRYAEDLSGPIFLELKMNKNASDAARTNMAN